MIKESMMKWRVKKEYGCNSMEQEDIRKSLEILDSVLAQYDDDEGGLEARGLFSAKDGTWHDENGALQNGTGDYEHHCAKKRLAVMNFGTREVNSWHGRSDESFQTFSADGSTSQKGASASDQSRKPSAPPPVPKRNPATRLSSHENLLFDMDNACRKGDNWIEFLETVSASSATSDDRSTNHKDSLSRRGNVRRSTNSEHYLPGADNESHSLSNHHVISKMRAEEVAHKQFYTMSSNDEVLSDYSSAEFSSSSLQCTSNGSVSPSFSSTDMERSPSVAKRLAEFEMMSKSDSKSSKQDDGSVPLSTETTETLKPVTNSPFLKRKASKRVEAESSDGIFAQAKSKSPSLPISPLARENGVFFPSKRRESDNDACVNLAKDSKQLGKPASPVNKIDPTESKLSKSMVELQEKDRTAISQVDRIRRLDAKFAKVKFLLKTNQISILKTAPPDFTPAPPPKPPRKPRASSQGEQSSRSQPASHITNSDVQNSTQTHESFNNILKNELSLSCVELSHRISGNEQESSYRLWNSHRENNIHKMSSLSNTIEDIPKLLPTDTLNRPQLGLSYTMEDDLSPGVKEILASTPKSDKSIRSTFNESFSSLGYGSSQSDLDLSLREGDKIPVTNLKCKTLPTGAKPTPEFYRAADEEVDCDSLGSYKLKVSVEEHENEDDHFRSSSAPPFKHLENFGKKKKLFGMSKKDKSRHNNECNISMKSDLSLDMEQSVILQKVGALRTPQLERGLKVSKETGAVTEEKTKRRSVWKSILRRK